MEDDKSFNEKNLMTYLMLFVKEKSSISFHDQNLFIFHLFLLEIFDKVRSFLEMSKEIVYFFSYVL